MINFDDLIKYENEHTGLDFKAIQYKKKQYENFIKDVMAMANADIETDRYIIIGVKHSPSGDREILNIEKESFIDPAIYQQLIRENVEPEIYLDYFPYNYQGKRVGIFKISNCFDKPYMMRKDFGKLKKGDSFIRKGAQQSKMERRDIDKIIENRIQKIRFDGEVELSFIGCGFGKQIELETIGDIELPSQKAAKKIKKIIKEKQLAKVKNNSQSNFSSISSLLRFPKFINPLASLPYEERSLEELKKNLEEVEQTYFDDDCYEFFELNSHKLNISIFNKGKTYIEDSSIRVEFDAIEGLIIADKVYAKPNTKSYPFLKSPFIPSYDYLNYPKVEKIESFIIISQIIGNIKHRIPIEAFKVPIRIILSKQLTDQVIEMKCKIYGKNLPELISKILKIKAVSQS